MKLLFVDQVKQDIGVQQIPGHASCWPSSALCKASMRLNVSVAQALEDAVLRGAVTAGLATTVARFLAGAFLPSAPLVAVDWLTG